ncbi:MAG: hypothetical protein K8R06_07605 [Methanosarcinales archaeon]|nr:hypothetical protein [Methanosarcinales archaeon]
MRTGTITGILIIALVALSAGVAAAQYGDSARYMDGTGDCVRDNNCGLGCGGSGTNFVDVDDDGVCDNFGTNGNDDDNDGIPNGMDEDYERPQDGSGNGGKCNGCNW